jgi:hypothetical protein
MRPERSQCHLTARAKGLCTFAEKYIGNVPKVSFPVMSGVR